MIPDPIDGHSQIQKHHCVAGNTNNTFLYRDCLSCSAYLTEDHCFLGGSPAMGYTKLNRQADVSFLRLSCCCRDCMTNKNEDDCALQELIHKCCKQTKVLPAVDANDNAVLERYVTLSFILHV